MKSKAIFLFLFVVAHAAKAQNTVLTTKIFTLINEARTNPAAFLKAHKADIQNYAPQYITFLQKAKSIPKIAWDVDLVAMAKAQVEDHNLNPDYKGKNTIYSMASGSNSGSISTDALSYVCHVYNNLHDEDNIYFGCYANKQMSAYTFYFGATCDSKKVTYTYDKKIDTSAVNYAKLNTAKNEKYITEAEAKMIAELNFVRQYPKVYATLIAKYLSDKSASYGGLDKNEYEAGMELIDDLNKLGPMPLLQPRQCVYTAAKKHGEDCQKRGFFAHEGSNGKGPNDRILDECTDLGSGNENGVGNSDTGVRAPIITLLIDEGISSRGHRYNIIDKSWIYVGCYRYADKTYGFQWVQNFAH